MRTFIIATLLLAAFAMPAYAQQEKYDAEDAAKARDAAALDKQYKTILELTDKPAQGKTDPWQNMRGSSSSSTTTDASKPKR
jgi:uncharacterized damage-inducible protein DinB